MRYGIIALGLTALLLLIPTGCADKVTNPNHGDPVEVRLHVTGGFAPTDFTIRLDGNTGVLTAESCVTSCDFVPGQVLATLIPYQISYNFGLLRAAGILEMDGTDFGTQCCDQIHVEIDYRDEDGSSSVNGTVGAFPEDLAHAVSALLSLIWSSQPLVVDFEQDRGAWPHDPLELETPVITGGHLAVPVHYGGGCRTHRIEGVAWGGWMESDPVHVKVFLAHDDHDDPCDAYLTWDLRFDLAPLKAAYQAAYGAGDPGETTLRILLEDPRLASPLGAWVLDYTF